METYLPHESDPYVRRVPCGYCGKDSVYTRAYLNRELIDCLYLCYCCGIDFVDKNVGWELIQTKVTFSKIEEPKNE